MSVFRDIFELDYAVALTFTKTKADCSEKRDEKQPIIIKSVSKD
jgi:hypothetical protein